MECKECGTCLRLEAHHNRICFDCYMEMDLADHEASIQKKTSEEEE